MGTLTRLRKEKRKLTATCRTSKRWFAGVGCLAGPPINQHEKSGEMGMRVNRFALAISLCAGLAMFAGLAHAGTPSDLLQGSFSIVSSQEPNVDTCTVSAINGTFSVTGDSVGNDGGTAVSVHYNTIQPTSVSRKTTTASI